MTLTLAVIFTGAKIFFGLLLMVGWRTRTAALLSGILLMAFGLALPLGAQAPLDVSVFSATGGPRFEQECERFPFSVDGLLLTPIALNTKDEDGIGLIDLLRAGVKERRDPNIGRHARSVGTVLVEMAQNRL